MIDHFTPATLAISLSAVAENYKILSSQTAAQTGAMLKADAYGIGAVPVFETLRKQGCNHFFVATPDEAQELRSIDGAANIYVLSGLYKGAEDFFAKRGIIPVLNSYEEIERYGKFAKNTKLPIALHFDTGMNRLGLGADETQKLLGNLSVLAPFDLKLIMSHFACSDKKDHEMNNRQAQAFSAIAKHFRNVPKSFCNSSAIFRNQDWHYDILRPGYALYGGNPTLEVTNPMRSVLSLGAKILQIRTVINGESVGYGMTHICESATTLATVAVGYADGFLRSGNGHAKLFWNGQACPILGRISMDFVVVDLGHINGQKPTTGDTIEILGANQSIDDLAKDCGTIGYEILTSLGARYTRVYV